MITGRKGRTQPIPNTKNAKQNFCSPVFCDHDKKIIIDGMPIAHMWFIYTETDNIIGTEVTCKECGATQILKEEHML